MALQLNISYDDLKDLLKQLNDEQKRDLTDYLSQITEQGLLSKSERKALYQDSILSIPVQDEPSIRRED